MRIIFTGASLTEGIYGGNFVAGVAKLLPQHEIVNAGVGGSTMNRLMERLDGVIAQQPDAVFIMAGSNDAIAYSQPATRPYYKSSQGLPKGYLTPEEVGGMYREMLSQLQLAHILPLVALPPLEYNPELAAASGLFNAQATDAARAYNVPVLDLNPPLMPDVASIPPRPPLDLRIIFQIGERTQSGWSDYAAEQARGGYSYSFDGIHFTPQTADKVAEIVAGFLTETLG
jgi:lysophospholipase L1-like esterase